MNSCFFVLSILTQATLEVCVRGIPLDVTRGLTQIFNYVSLFHMDGKLAVTLWTSPQPLLATRVFTEIAGGRPNGQQNNATRY